MQKTSPKHPQQHDRSQVHQQTINKTLPKHPLHPFAPHPIYDKELARAHARKRTEEMQERYGRKWSTYSFAELRLHSAIRKQAFIALVCTNLRHSFVEVYPHPRAISPRIPYMLVARSRFFSYICGVYTEKFVSFCRFFPHYCFIFATKGLSLQSVFKVKLPL